MGQKISETKKLFRWLHWPPLLTFSLVFILFFVLSYLKLDPDFGWHLMSGDYFVHHAIPATDIFTYTASDFPWVNHEWLSDIILYYLYSFGGYTLLALVYASLWTLAFFLVARKSYGPLIILGVLAVLPFAGIRAVTWTVLGVVLVYRIVQARDRRWRYILPLLFLLWANIHGGFAIGLVLLGYWAIVKRSKQLLLLLGGSILVTFINPYGVDLYVEIFRTTLDGSLRWVINEWVPIGSVWQTIAYVAIWGAGFLLLLGKKWRSYLQVDVLLFFAALSSIRHYPLFVVLSLPYTTEYVKELAIKIPTTIDTSRRNVIWFVIVVITLFVGWTGYDVYAISPNREDYYPVHAVTYLEQHPCKGNLFNEYGIGGYLIWKLPGYKVYIDGRMPSWEGGGHKYMSDYTKIFTDASFRDGQFAVHNITCVLVPINTNRSSMTQQLIRNGWHTANKGEGYILLEK